MGKVKPGPKQEDFEAAQVSATAMVSSVALSLHQHIDCVNSTSVIVLVCSATLVVHQLGQ